MIKGQPATARTEALLNRAEDMCRRRGVHLTELRRKILGLVLDTPAPAGAYDLLHRLRRGRRTAAPPTVYRALEFLLDQGLIHKVESLSAYVGCAHTSYDEGVRGHPAQFLICDRCGRVIELDDPGDPPRLDACHRSTRVCYRRVDDRGEGNLREMRGCSLDRL